MKGEVNARKGICAVSSARSGGDALRQRDCRRLLLQYKDEKSWKLRDSWNARNEVAKVDRHGAGQVDWIDKIASCPVYYPTEEEFGDPLQYIQNIAAEAAEYGMCKIVSPLVACVPAGIVLTKEQSGFKFTTRVQPMRLANWDKDDKTTFPLSGRHYSLTEYEKAANKFFSRKFSTTGVLPTKFVEAEFWKELVSGKTRTVEYACDVEGSAFSESSLDSLGQSKWNLKGISRLPNSTLRLLNVVIPGVTEPMLYIGMLFSMFAWHIEDHYLYSINYHHCGAPKTWYGVPGSSAPDFEKIVQEHVYETEMLNDAGKGTELDLLLGKTTMFAPKLLSEHGVPVFRAVQNPGEFVITFPRAYHAGFSHGFNCGEAVNFAMADWFPFGAAACLRYEFLNRTPLLPHEELLCKEAMIVAQIRRSSNNARECKQQTCVKVAFVALIQSQLQAHEFLKQRGAKRIATSNLTCVLCGLCKHACYISYTMCNCYPEPMCVNHERVFNACTCGSDRSLVVRHDLADLQVVAQKYECEDEILSEVLKGPSICDTFVKGAGSGLGEEMQIERSTSVGPAAADGLCKADLSGIKRKNFGDENSVVHPEGVRALDYKPVHEEEDSSDSEVFRVKRRRVIPSRSQRFRVDEQVLSPKKLSKQSLVTGLDNKKDVVLKEKMHKHSMKGYSVLVTDVMNELGLEGSKEEAIEQWQHDARSRGMTLKFKQVYVADKLVEALSLKSCKYLKQILPEKQARRLQLLMQQVHQPTTVALVNSSCSIQGDNALHLFGSTDEPVSGVVSCKETVVSVCNNDFCERVHKSILHNKGTLQEAFSEDDVVDSCTGSMKKKAYLDTKECSLQGKGNIHTKECSLQGKGNIHREAGIVKNTDDGTFSHEGLSNNMDSHYRKLNQKVSRLRVKGPTPPILKHGIPQLEKEARQADKERNSQGCDDRKVVQCCSNSDDCKRKNGRDLLSGPTVETKLSKEHGKERTEIILGSERNKIFIVHLNRKLDPMEGACNVDRRKHAQEPEKDSLGTVLKLAERTAGIPATSGCSKAASACTSAVELKTADTLGTSGDSMQHTVAADLSLEELEVPTGSLSEEGKLRKEYGGSRNCFGPPHVDNSGLWETEHKVHDSTSEVNYKSSVRSMKSSASSKKLMIGRLEHGLLDGSTLLPTKEETEFLPHENSKKSLCHSTENYHAKSTTENNDALSHHQKQRKAQDLFTRVSCPDENLSVEKLDSQPGSQMGFSLRGCSIRQTEAPPNTDLKGPLYEAKHQVCPKEEALVCQNTMLGNYGQAQNMSPSGHSSVSGRCTAPIKNHRCGRTVSRKKSLHKSKSSHQSHHYSHSEGSVKSTHFFEGKEKMPHGNWPERLSTNSRRSDGIEMEGKICTVNGRTEGGFNRLKGVVSGKSSSNEAYDIAERETSLAQNRQQHSASQNYDSCA